MRLLITAGPTREPIDSVRFISNRSSGKVGLALAQAALDAKHAVTLLLGPGPGDADAPPGCALHRFETTDELESLLRTHWPSHDALIMAAAVADYRPAKPSAGKLPRGERMTVELEPTPDLVASLATAKRPNQRVIAFALEEPAQLEARAAAKLRRKNVDAIVANPLNTMDADAITPLWLTAGGERESPGAMSKAAFSRWLVAKL